MRVWFGRFAKWPRNLEFPNSSTGSTGSSPSASGGDTMLTYNSGRDVFQGRRQQPGATLTCEKAPQVSGRHKLIWHSVDLQVSLVLSWKAHGLKHNGSAAYADDGSSCSLCPLSICGNMFMSFGQTHTVLLHTWRERSSWAFLCFVFHLLVAFFWQ